MAAPSGVVSLEEKFDAFDQKWSPKVIGEFNDMQLKAVKVDGDFVWHAHEETDEFFLVRSGRLTIHLADREDVIIGPGEFFIVPRGVEHCPSAEEESEVLLIEPAGVINTGEVQGSDLTAAQDEWI